MKDSYMLLRRLLVMIAVLWIFAVAAHADDFEIEVIDAQPIFNEDTGSSTVLVRLSGNSAEVFGRFIRDNVKKKIKIMVDGEVRLTPFIQEPIVPNSFPIGGMSSLDEAANVASRLAAGESVITVGSFE